MDGSRRPSRPIPINWRETTLNGEPVIPTRRRSIVYNFPMNFEWDGPVRQRRPQYSESEVEDLLCFVFKQISKLLKQKNQKKQRNQKKKRRHPRVTCMICMDRKLTHFLPCLHVYCEECILRFMEAEDPSCPQCRQSFSRYSALL